MSAKHLFSSLLFVAVLSLASSYADTNVLVNPGFESGTTGWSDRWCSFTTVASPVHGGSLSGRAYDRTATYQGLQQDMMNKMVIGEAYTISGWIRTSSASSETVKVSVQKTDASNDGNPTYVNVDTDTANSSGWTYLTGNYTLTVTGTLTQLLVYFEGPPSGVDIYVDDANVYGPEVGPVDPNATGEVDVNTRHQEIEGFGAAGAWYENWLIAHPNNVELYDLLFDDLGLDIYRIRNTYGQGSGGTTYMSNTETIVDEALQRNPNLKIMISCWTPPWTSPYDLKSNGEPNGGTLDGGPSAYRYGDLADWWADSLTDACDGWPSYGVDADYISIQNEPDWEANWDTCRYEPTETSSYAGYDEAFEAVYAELYSRFGSSMPKMIAPETTGFNGAAGSSLSTYLSAMTNHSHVYGYCHHLYNINAGDNPDAYLSAMQSFNSSWGTKPLMQTEYEKSTDSWPDALNLAHLLHNSLTAEEVSVYVYWDLFWGTSGGLVTFPSYGVPTYTINSDYYGMKHYSAFIFPGWERVDATDDSGNVLMSAYISPDEQQLTAVIINTSASTDIDLDLSFTGFTIASGDIYRSSSTQNCVNIGSYNPSNPLTLPAQTITTLALSAPVGTQQTLSVSSGSGGSVTTPGEGDFQYDQDSNAVIIASPDQYYHFDVWTGTAVTAGKVADPCAASTTVFMDANYTVVANFEANPPDLDPPEPNVMTWASVPTATGSSTITMTATTATDDSEPVKYYFECTTDSDANSPDWQIDPNYTATGLAPSTQYTFRVKARDNAIIPNETGWSSAESATTEPPSTDVNIIGSWVSGTSHSKPAGNNRALLFFGHAESNSGDPNLGTVTYGGQPMTKVVDRVYTSGLRAYVAAFILNEAGVAAATSSDFAVSWDVAPSATAAFASVFLENVDQSDPVGETGTGGSTSSIAETPPLSTNDGDMAFVGGTCGNTGTYSTINGFNEGIEVSPSSADGVAGYLAATGSDVTPGVSHGNVNRQAVIGFVVQAAAAVIDNPPAAPTGLTATAGNDLVSLNWNDNNEVDLDGYNVYRSMTSGSDYNQLNVSLVSDSNYVDNDVNNGTPYYYVVTAVDANAHESGYSNEANATPDYQGCQDVIDGGYGLVSDITGDCYVNYQDVARISLYWLYVNCGELDDCENADLEPDGDVDLVDFSDFAVDWLQCNHPQDANCIANW